tara:strand:- start:149 stop:499 length:351 start_codon:yes stop_codon:yes gene_type:complete
MKRTEEALLIMVKEEVKAVTKEMVDEMANRIMEKVCKRALIQVLVVNTEVLKRREGQSEADAMLEAKYNMGRVADTKTRSQIKIGPSTQLREPLLLDIKEMIEKEMKVPYLQRGAK